MRVEPRKTPNSQAILRKKTKLETSGFLTPEESGAGVETDADINRTEGAQKQIHTHGQLISNKGAKNTREGKNSLFDKQTVLGTQDSHVHKSETRPLSHTTHENPLKWIKDVNVRREALTPLEQDTAGELLDASLGDEFLDPIPKAKAIKAKLSQRDHIKRRRFRTAKETIGKMNGQPWEKEKIFANHTSNGVNI